MMGWLKRYWPALVVVAMMLAVLDSVLSSLATCHPITNQASSGANPQKQQECTALAGPILLSLIAIVDFMDKHGEAIAGAFTIVLAIFTGRLWSSTEKLWSVTNKSVDLARDDFNATHRPWIPLTNAELSFGVRWAKKNAIIGINVFCRNTGDSPARRVSLAVGIFPSLTNEEVPKKMDEVLAAHRSDIERRQFIEYTVFPGEREDLRLSQTMMIPESEIADLKDYFGEPAEEMLPVIVGAIEYYFSFGESVPHYTPFVYHVWLKETEGVAQRNVQLDGKDVQARDMILVPLINAGDPT
jgi:hypothetical protein